MPVFSYQDDLELIKQAVTQAGVIACDGFNSTETEVWDKEIGHPVTETDIAVNDFLFQTLTQARPDYGWLSEETKDDDSRHKKTRSFVIDPIDGTRAFIEGSPNFMISVAVIEAGETIAAALLNPLKEETYLAVKGGGATLNDKSISVSSCKSLKGCKMIGLSLIHI